MFKLVGVNPNIWRWRAVSVLCASAVKNIQHNQTITRIELFLKSANIHKTLWSFVKSKAEPLLYTY